MGLAAWGALIGGAISGSGGVTTGSKVGAGVSLLTSCEQVYNPCGTLLEVNLDAVAKHTLGESFKEANPTAFENIDLLFRCRNKVAHKGELTYRLDSGIQHSVNRETLETWWASTEELMVWIRNAKTSAQQGPLATDV